MVLRDVGVFFLNTTAEGFSYAICYNCTELAAEAVFGIHSVVQRPCNALKRFLYWLTQCGDLNLPDSRF